MGSKKTRNLLYEVPEISYSIGIPVTFENFDDAKKAAHDFNASVIHEVKGKIAPILNGDIWQLSNSVWCRVPKDYRCECCSSVKTA